MKRCRTCQIQRACDKINGMKKHDFLLVGIVLAAALLFFLVRNMLIEPGNVLEITVDGEAYGTYSLQEDQTIEIRDGNICRIEGGEVSMIWATARTCSASIRRLWESMAEILSACPPGGAVRGRL